MYIYIYIYIHVNVYTHIHIHIYIYIHTYTYMYMSRCVYIYIYTHMCVYINIKHVEVWRRRPAATSCDPNSYRANCVYGRIGWSSSCALCRLIGVESCPLLTLYQ